MSATGTGFTDEHESVLLRTRGELKAYATALAGSASRADDLVQEASLRALQHGPGLPPAERLRAWMFRVVGNLHVDGHRRRGVREAHRARAVHEAEARGVATDEAWERVLLSQALAALGDDHREIVYLIDVVGMSYAEAAELLGIPAGTVMSRISRARRELLDASAETERDPPSP